MTAPLIESTFPLVYNGQYRRRDDGTRWLCVAAVDESVKKGGQIKLVPWIPGLRGARKPLVKHNCADAAALFDHVPVEVEDWRK
jgi:hypothetical protein